MSSGRVVLVDTNVIIHCHEIGCWKALAGQYHLETVDQCVIETQTGRQRRRPELQINEAELRAQFKAVHVVTQQHIAQVMAMNGGALDDGERDLWAHALQREDAWILCGPDRASMKFGYDARLRERLVSLGELVANFSPAPTMKQNYTKPWLDEALQKFALGIL